MLAMAGVTLIISCEKYEKEINYASLTGSFVDALTGTKLDVGSITLSPAQVTNGSMVLDTAGNFKNTRILPGNYKIYGSIKAAFKSDSASISLQEGQQGNVVLKIEPWLSVGSYVDQVSDTTANVRFKIQGNKGMLPARHVVVWSSSPNPNVTVYTNPTNTRYFVTPAVGAENGTFNYKITGLAWNTVYFVRVGARINDPALNPGNDYNYARQMIIKTPVKP